MPKLNIRGFEDKVFIFHSLDKLPFLEDRKLVQEFYLFPNSKYICDFWGKNEDIEYQVIFPLTSNWDYNNYFILIRNKKTNSSWITGYRSKTAYPPVWDRSFSFGPDYIDYVGIQKDINRFLKSENLKEINIDEAFEGKTFNCSTDTLEVIQDSIKNGKSYSVLSVKAETMAEHIKLKQLENYEIR